HTGLYYFSLFRYDSMCLDVQKMRLLAVLSAPYDEDKKRAFLESSPDTWTPVQRFLDSAAQALSGDYCVATQLIDQFKGPRFDLGYPELYPTFRELESGEIVVRAYQKPPAGVEIPTAKARSDSHAVAE